MVKIAKITLVYDEVVIAKHCLESRMESLVNADGKKPYAQIFSKIVQAEKTRGTLTTKNKPIAKIALISYESDYMIESLTKQIYGSSYTKGSKAVANGIIDKIKKALDKHKLKQEQAKQIGLQFKE